MIMKNDAEERERVRMLWIRTHMPFATSMATIALFCILKIAGETDTYALLFAASMFFFVGFMAKTREWFGVDGFVAVMCATAAILWGLQRIGWL
ncbi:hypothetical protein E2K80_10850 [Rhodophyticola sp. CCM32]|uniref:hypothetical protein n=1 Tax=Rhodophyticola sp. CCM32 TaxID=2916397 RepID=UPI00107EFCB8|nr:hypothetical protein [Rhodophyticola sp. CCM32]QBY01161.1 hypothetical protein E2K80_10850 [Rhodophyticola sp. CCM32]